MRCCQKKITGVGVAFLFVALTGACGAKHRDAILPTGSAPRAPSISASPVSADDAVRQSYTGYWTALPRAEHTDDPARRRQLLAEYATDPQLTTALQGIDDLHNKGLTSSGYVIVHIRKVRMGSDTATVWDCQDTTKAVIQKSDTGEIVSHGDPKILSERLFHEDLMGDGASANSHHSAAAEALGLRHGDDHGHGDHVGRRLGLRRARATAGPDAAGDPSVGLLLRRPAAGRRRRPSDRQRSCPAFPARR